MAFIAKVIALKTDYDKINPDDILKCLDIVARGVCRVGVESKVDFGEYINKTSSSKEIPRYIRMDVKTFKQMNTGIDVENKEYVDIKYDQGKVEHNNFANSKYTVLSLCQYDNYTLVWFNIHPNFEEYVKGFGNIFPTLAKYLSKAYSTESIYMYASSKNRNDARYMIFSGGNIREEDSGKSCLTALKSDYKIDINMCMDYIDNNVAIYYAPFDFAKIQEQLVDQARRYKMFIDRAGIKDYKEWELEVDNEKRSAVLTFLEDHKQIIDTLTKRKQTIEKALAEEGFGDLIFFKLNILPPSKSVIPPEEMFLGKR